MAGLHPLVTQAGFILFLSRVDQLFISEEDSPLLGFTGEISPGVGKRLCSGSSGILSEAARLSLLRSGACASTLSADTSEVKVSAGRCFRVRCVGEREEVVGGQSWFWWLSIKQWGTSQKVFKPLLAFLGQMH